MTRYLILIMLPILSACQAEYDQLQPDQVSIESRTLEGNMAEHWATNIEPIVQSSCIQCHSAGDPLSTGLEFQSSQANTDNQNIMSALTVVQQSRKFNITSNNHLNIADLDRANIRLFEDMGIAYWGWVQEIELAKSMANHFFEANIEDSIIQPACASCHGLLMEGQSPVSNTLTFYIYSVEDHGKLNSQQALSYLLSESNPELMYQKAIGELFHGGGVAISGNSVYSDLLKQHADYTEKIIELINTPPY